MVRLILMTFLVSNTFTYVLCANPYPDPSLVPQDLPHKSSVEVESLPQSQPHGIEILRVDFDWKKTTDTFEFSQAILENSGTDALLRRAIKADPHGSYRALLYDTDGTTVLAQDSLGTGKEFRLLSRGLSFRFPVPAAAEFLVALVAENPLGGQMEEVLRRRISKSDLQTQRSNLDPRELEIRNLKNSAENASLVVNIYAEGYIANRRQAFFDVATRTVEKLAAEQLPYWNHITINAVYYPSRQKLGNADDLGDEAIQRDSFLSLYFPYWHKFGRWYHVVYPTDYKYFRNALGVTAYDYPLVLIDDSRYWGVGNFKELTAVPAHNSSFTYLLMHEFGHYLGLNEEYEGGGPTELEFAPGMDEPWSQNMTFHPQRENLKWLAHVNPSTPLPTASSYWQNTSNGPWGAYRGGYADSESDLPSYKPGFECRMESGQHFCPICADAIAKRFAIDIGI